MKILEVTKSFLGKTELYSRDFPSEIRGVIPGEWVYFKFKHFYSLGFINPFVETGAIARIVCSIDKIDETKNETEIAASHIERSLKSAINFRNKFKNYQNNSRLVYGEQDNLPGLIIDSYQNATIVQINTAGIDRFRDLIKSELSNLLPAEVYFLDNKDYRAIEGLPVFEIESFDEVNVLENGLNYNLDKSVAQKVGYYYDHRENRLSMQRWIEQCSIKFDRGVDLFSYAGSWGLNALKAGVGFVTFVDQGDFGQTISDNLKNNAFEGRGEFVRADVFDWLSTQKSGSYNLVISDPPAFSKSLKSKNKALVGYEKLHRMALKLVSKNGLFIAASCTHGVSHEELDKTVQLANLNLKRNLRLIDIGLQGIDHPISHLSNRDFYIKYLLYAVDC